MLYMHQYPGKVHLLLSRSLGICLDASPRKKLTSKEFNRGSFSPCRWDANQFWELNTTGALINCYSGQCAIVKSVKEDTGYTGIRSWIATGRRGQVYVAFFNMNSVKTVISTTISDLAKALPSKKLNGTSCASREVWSGNYSRITRSISNKVEPHGADLCSAVTSSILIRYSV